MRTWSWFLLTGLLASASLTGCYTFHSFKPANNKAEVVKATADVLKERFYLTRVYADHVLAVTPVELEGAYPVRKKIDVYVTPETTGHYYPRVYVRHFYDMAEPEMERGDTFSAFELGGHPFARSNWQATHFDRKLEEEIRQAILDRLMITT